MTPINNDIGKSINNAMAQIEYDNEELRGFLLPKLIRGEIDVSGVDIRIFEAEE